MDTLGLIMNGNRKRKPGKGSTKDRNRSIKDETHAYTNQQDCSRSNAHRPLGTDQYRVLAGQRKKLEARKMATHTYTGSWSFKTK
jgi:hypothetical protein